MQQLRARAAAEEDDAPAAAAAAAAAAPPPQRPTVQQQQVEEAVAAPAPALQDEGGAAESEKNKKKKVGRVCKQLLFDFIRTTIVLMGIYHRCHMRAAVCVPVLTRGRRFARRERKATS